jgi:hypothetical protein
MERASIRQIGVEVTMPSRRRLSLRQILALIGSLSVAACDYRGPVGDDLAVRPLAPTNGASMPLKASATVARPVFRWSATPAASRFELQIDDSCASADSCVFPSPEIDETALAATTYTPANGLAAGASVPVTRRYYWHVRACATDVCGSWSVARYVVVGTSMGLLNADLNGDGYEDAVVAAPSSSAGAQQAGSVAVYLGSPTVSTSPALVITHDRAFEELGHSVAMVGDVNGDGFGDFLVRTLGDESTIGVAPAAHAYIYFGGPALHAQPDVVLDCGSVDDENGAAAGIGDVNGDGYDDVAIGGVTVDAQHHALPPTRVDIHFGGPAMANAPDLTLLGETSNPAGNFFGSAIAGVGDVNDDGYPDFVVGSHDGPGVVRVYFGGPGLNPMADVTLTSPPGAGVLFGFSVAGIGDFNGDGIPDLAVGAPGNGPFPGPLGSAHVYFGGTSLSSTPGVTFTGKNPGDWFGAVVAGARDVDEDGFDDVAVLTRGVAGIAPTPLPAVNNLHVDLFRGGATAATSAWITHQAGPATAYRRGLAVRDLDGDSRPDLLVGRFVTDDQGIGLVDVVLGVQGYSTAAVTLSGAAAGDEFGAVIGR